MPSHRVHGYCCLCKDRTVAEELAAWQVYEQARHDAAQVHAARRADQTEAAVDRVRALHANEDGYCAHCKGEWGMRWPCPTIRALGGDDADDEPTPFAADVSSRTYACPRCGMADTVLEATFLVTTKAAVHTVGRFAFCFACESAQEAAGV
jgi:hypothetical protein